MQNTRVRMPTVKKPPLSSREREKKTSGWIDGWMNEWMDGWMNEETLRAGLLRPLRDCGHQDAHVPTGGDTSIWSIAPMIGPMIGPLVHSLFCCAYLSLSASLESNEQ